MSAMDLTPGPSEDQKRSGEIDTDTLPPTQYLILEVLAARHRTGEMLWTFPSRLRPHLRALGESGLVGWRSGPAPATVQAWLTDAGRDAALMDGYETPVEKERAVAYRAGREDAAKAIEAERDRWERLGYDDGGAWVAAVRIARGTGER